MVVVRAGVGKATAAMATEAVRAVVVQVQVMQEARSGWDTMVVVMAGRPAG